MRCWPPACPAWACRCCCSTTADTAATPAAPSEKGLAADARAAQAWLATQPEVDPDRIVYFGESLGAAVAIGLAMERPPAALVLRSPFTSLAEVAKVHYPWLPVGRLLIDRYPSIDRIGSLVGTGHGDRR